MLGALALLVLLVFGDLLLTGSTRMIGAPGTDLDQQFVAWRAFGFRELARGNLALWNPHIFGGAPYFGGFQAALLYPVNWLFLVLPLPQALDWSVAINQWLLGTFMAWWAHERGLHPLAALVSGALLMFCGPYFGHVYPGHLTNLAAMTWAPLLFLAFDGYVRSRRPGYCVLGALGFALQLLAGHPQYVFYTAIALIVYASARLWSAAHEARWAATALGMFFIAGSLLAAAQLFPALTGTSETIRADALPYDFAKMFAFPIENLATLLSPTGFGDNTRLPYWGRGYLWEHTLFVGVAGIALAAYGAAKGQAPDKRALLTLALVAFVLALGSGTPLFSFLYTVVPGFDRFRAIAKFCFFCALVLCLFAGVGLDRVLTRGEAERGVVRVCGALGGALLVLALSFRLFPFSSLLELESQSGEAYLPARVYTDPSFVARAQSVAADAVLIAALTLLIVTWLLHVLCSDSRATSIRPARAAAALAALAVVEVVAFARAGRATLDYAQLTDSPLASFVAQAGPDVRVSNPTDPNSAMLFGGFDVWGADPGVTRRWAELVSFTQGIPPERATQYVQLQRPHPLLSLLRLRAVAANVQGKLVNIDAPIAPLPRFLLVPRYRVMPDRDARLRALARSDFDPRNEVLLEAEPSPAPVAVSGAAQVIVLREDTDEVDLQAQLDAPALLLVTDAWAPSWSAAPLPGSAQQHYQVLPADHALRAIPLSAGRHRLRMAYTPRTYPIGLVTSLVAWLAFGAVLIWLWRRRANMSAQPAAT